MAITLKPGKGLVVAKGLCFRGIYDETRLKSKL